MKLLLALAATLIAFSAQANDRKLGNVIAVEREITNIYENCAQNIMGDTSKDQPFFSCSINFLKSSTETALTKGGLVRFKNNDCSVNIDTGNGVLLATFGKAKGVSSLNAAKSCLQQALANQNSLNVLVYTVE